MIVYAAFLFFFSALAILTGTLMYLGRYELVYGYRPRSFNSPIYRAYNRALGIATACMSLPAVLGGVLFLRSTPDNLAGILGIAALILGVAAEYAAYCLIRKHFSK